MGHVFISYARSDEPLAQLIADELGGAGFEVWRDDQLPAHRPYAEVIEERINGAQAVVVLWSGEAARSHWVRAEADTAREARKLVQASLDGSLPPMPFNQIQWVHSYVTDNKIYCIYRAPNEEIIREHARLGGFPANKISQIKTMIDPTTAE